MALRERDAGGSFLFSLVDRLLRRGQSRFGLGSGLPRSWEQRAGGWMLGVFVLLTRVVHGGMDTLRLGLKSDAFLLATEKCCYTNTRY